MFPQRPETVTTLATGPEHAGEHKERPDKVSDAAHDAILGIGGASSRLSQLFPSGSTAPRPSACIRALGLRKAAPIRTYSLPARPYSLARRTGGDSTPDPTTEPAVLACKAPVGRFGGPSSGRHLPPTRPAVRLPLMEDRSERVASLLDEAGETHHRVYRIVDGDDPDWASWYADWLLNLSELPQILGIRPVRSELVWLLVQLDKEYTQTNSDVPWPRWYASRVLEHFGATAE
jgi:hypothetical protein